MEKQKVTVSTDFFRKNNLNEGRKFAVIGFIAGFVFIFMALGLELIIHDLSACCTNFSVIFKTCPCMYIVLSAPVVLGTVGFFIGQLINNNCKHSLERLNQQKNILQRVYHFAEAIISDNLHVDYKLEGDDDKLGKILIRLRDNLIKTKEDVENQKEEERKRSWANEGLAKFSDILRKDNDDLPQLSYNVLSNLVKYLEINQGGFFIINDEVEDDKHIEMIACYAYNRKKYKQKRIEWGEGLVGRCVYEKETVYLTEVPSDYVYITSGLGKETPSCILIVPLIINDEIFGAIELGSFDKLPEYKIQFIERIAESIASTISGVKINMRTSKLLKESQEQAQKMAEQEETMRQNMEELQATQEEAARHEKRMLSFANTVDHTLMRAEYTTDGILTHANTRFIDSLEYDSDEELYGKHISRFIDPKDRTWFERMWEPLANGGRHYDGHMKHVKKDGNDLWMLATFTCVRNDMGVVEKVLFLGLDQTKEKQQSLNFESQIEAINRSSSIIEFDAKKQVLDANTVLLELLGMGMRELAEKSLHDLIHKEDKGVVNTSWGKTINGMPFLGQMRIIAKNKKDKWFQASLTAVHDMYGNVVKVIFLGNDITQQKEMEIEAQEHAEELLQKEEQLKQHVENLEVVQEEMKQKNIQIEAEQKKTEGILDGCEEAIITFDNKSNIELINPAAEELLGVEKDSVIGNPIQSLLPLKLDESISSKGIMYVNDGNEQEIAFNSKTEIFINTKQEDDKSVLINVKRIKTRTGTVYTIFMQNIEVELF